MMLAVGAGDAPELGFAFRLGASLPEAGAAVAVDAQGNVYIAGLYDGSLDFDPGAGTTKLSGDAFVAKYAPNGSLAWARSITGDIHYEGADLCVDGDGNVYLTGGYQGRIDFDPGAGATYLNSGLNPAGFVLKLNGSGSFAWAKSFSGGETNGMGIAVDGSGNVYTTGFFSDSVDFDPGPGAATLSSAGSYDAYVSKLDSAGTYVWAKRMGGGYPTPNSYDAGDRGQDIAVDPDGNVYTTGTFRGHIDFNPDPAAQHILISSGNVGEPHDHYNDAFVWKLDTDGDFVWAKRLGGPAEGRSIAVDAQRNVYTAGVFYGTGADFDPGDGVYHVESSGDKTVYVSKLSSAGDFIWAGGMASNPVMPFTSPQASLGLDATGSVYVAGQFRGTTDFDPELGSAFELASAGGSDVFMSRLDAQTGALEWAGAMGGPGDDLALAMAVGPASTVFTTGSFRGKADFDPTGATHYLTSAGADDVFVSKLTYYRTGRLTLSTDSSSPFMELVVTSDTPLDTASPITARFSDASGYTLDVPVVSATADSATLLVPPYVDPTTGQITTGTVEVQLVQGGRVIASGSAPLEIAALADSPFPAGTITLGYLRAAAEEARAQQDALRWTLLDTVANNAALAVLADRLEWLVDQVQGVVNTPGQTVSLGKAGTRDVVLDSTALAQMDRLLRGIIEGEAAMGTLSVTTLRATSEPGPRTRILADQELAMLLAGEGANAEAWRNHANVARTSSASLDDELMNELSMHEVIVGTALVGIGLAPLFTAGLAAGAVIGAPIIGAGLILFAGGALIQADLAQPGTIDNLLDQTKEAMSDAAKTMTQLAGAAQGTILKMAQEVKSSYAAIQSASKTRPMNEIHVVPATAATTYEDQSKPPAVFKVWLTNQPTGAVTLGFDADDGTEGGVTFGDHVVFGPGFWGPSEVWVKGADDDYADGDQPYSLGATVVSEDPAISTADITRPLVNIDNETPLTISIQDASVDEGPQGKSTQAALSVSLSSLCDIPITFRYRTVRGTAKEVADFQRIGWRTKTIPAGAQSVDVVAKVIGNDVDDPLDVRSFFVEIAPVSRIAAANTRGEVRINDDDTAGLIVEAMDNQTEWTGDTGTFRVRLASKPTKKVRVTVASTLPTEGKVVRSTFDFTPSDWKKWKTGTVRGQPDGEWDGNVAYQLTSSATSKDLKYQGNVGPAVDMVNLCDDGPGVSLRRGPGAPLDPDNPIQTTWEGKIGTFQARLNTKPTANVTILLVSSDNTEGQVVSPNFVFTPTNWSTWQKAEVKGIPDGKQDLFSPYWIRTSATISNDPNYSGIDVPDVNMVNLCNDPPQPGPWTVWIDIVGGAVGVIDGINPHKINTENGQLVGNYKKEAFVSLFGLVYGRWDSIWWKTTGNWVFGNTFTLSGNVLRNGVTVHVSEDNPLEAAVAGTVWRSMMPSEKDDDATATGGGLLAEASLLRPALVDAALAVAM